MPRLAKKCLGCGRIKAIDYFDDAHKQCIKCIEKGKRRRQKNSKRKKLSPEEIEFNKITSTMIIEAKKRAKKRNIPYDLTTKYIRYIYPKDNKCPYFGTKMRRGDGKFTNNSPSLDRIDPDKGYVKGNVEVISMRANMLKSNATLKELETILRRLRKILKNA